MSDGPVLWMLVGVPGSGKSTWITKLDVLEEGRGRDTTVLSTDYFIEFMAREMNKTYDEIFKDTIKDAEKKMYADLEWAISKGHNLVWDQTNLTVKTRQKKLAKVPAHYKKIGVWFPTPEESELQRRLASRPGKTIPEYILGPMIEMMEQPTLKEGFDIVRIRDV